MDKFFSSKYPILAAIMVSVSTVDFAIACHAAGIFPSLVLNEDSDTYHDELDQALKEFYKATGTHDINVGSNYDLLYHPKLISVLKSNQVSHIEFYAPRPITHGVVLKTKIIVGEERFKEMCENSFKDLQSNNVKIMRRISFVNTNVGSLYNALCLKGSDGAGYGGQLTTFEFFKQQQQTTPGRVLIPSGGVYSSQQVKEYIDLGATAVAVGTVLAASVESNVSVETKKKMIVANSKDLVTMPDTGQKALVFGDVDTVIANQERNRMSSFLKGLAGNGGHMYSGLSVDHVDEILPLNEIVARLVSEL